MQRHSRNTVESQVRNRAKYAPDIERLLGRSLGAERRAIFRGNGRWGDPSTPKRGWTFTGEIEDLGEPAFTCEMCEVMEIRYVHHVSHRNSPYALQVGCVCCEHMTGDYETPRKLEAQLKNLARRRISFPRLKGWRERETRNGAPFHKIKVGGFDLCVFERNDRFRPSISRASGYWFERGEEREWRNGRAFKDLDEAKRRAFDMVQEERDQ